MVETFGGGIRVCLQLFILIFLFIYFYAIYIYRYIANYGNLLPVASPSSLLGVEGLYLASHSFEISYEIQQLMSNIVSKKNKKNKHGYPSYRRRVSYSLNVILSMSGSIQKKYKSNWFIKNSSKSISWSYK